MKEAVEVLRKHRQTVFTCCWFQQRISFSQITKRRLTCHCKNGENYFSAGPVKAVRKSEVWLFKNWEFFFFFKKKFSNTFPPYCLTITVINALRVVKYQMLEKNVHNATKRGASCKDCRAGKLGSCTGFICNEEANLFFVTNCER